MPAEWDFWDKSADLWNISSLPSLNELNDNCCFKVVFSNVTQVKLILINCIVDKCCTFFDLNKDLIINYFYK